MQTLEAMAGPENPRIETSLPGSTAITDQLRSWPSWHTVLSWV